MKGQHKRAGKSAFNDEWDDDLIEGFDDLFDDEGYLRDNVRMDRLASKRRNKARRTLERLKEQISLNEDLQDFEHYLN